MSNSKVVKFSQEVWLTRMALGLCLLCLILPYVVTNDLIYPHITGRNFLFRTIIALGSGVVFIYAFTIGFNRFFNNKVTLLFLAFIGIKLLSVVFSVDVCNSLLSSLTRMDGVLLWFYLFLYYLLLRVALVHDKGLIILLRFTIFLATSSAAYLLMLWIGDTSVALDRQTFTFGNPAFYGTHMLFHSGLSAYLVIKERRKYLRVFWIISTVLCLIGLLMSGTRASMLGVSVGLVFILMLKFSNLNKIRSRINYKKIILAFAILAIGIFGVSNMHVQKLFPAVDRIQNTSLKQKEIRTRIGAVIAGLKGWKERPVLGWGDENYSYVYHKYNNQINVDRWMDKSHNQIIEVLVTNGLVGLFVFILLIVRVCRQLVSNKGDVANCILAATFLAWFVQNLFIFDTINSYLYLILLFGVASIATKDSEFKVNTNLRGITFSIVISTLSLFLTFYLYKDAYQSSKSIRKANESLLLSDFKEALSTNNLSNKEATVFLLANMPTMLQSDDLSSEDKIEIIDFGLSSANDQIERTPKDIKILLLSSRLYYSVKSYKSEYLIKAREIIEEAKNIAPYRTDVSNLYDKITRQ